MSSCLVFKACLAPGFCSLLDSCSKSSNESRGTHAHPVDIDIDIMSEPQSTSSLRLCIFSHPRTASNLFFKLFSAHPDIEQRLDPFLQARLYGPDVQDQLSSERLDYCRYAFGGEAPTLQAALDNTQAMIAECEAGEKIPCFKEHCGYLIKTAQLHSMLSRHGGLAQEPDIVDNMLDVPEQKRSHSPSPSPLDCNPTIFPDRFLHTLSPVFTIRHPAIQVPSWYRVREKKSLEVPIEDQAHQIEFNSSYKFSRTIFDYFRQVYRQDARSDTGSEWPIVIDAEDLIDDTERIASKFCEIAGVDPGGVIYHWDTKEPAFPMQTLFMSTLFSSSGVIKNPSPKRVTTIAECSKGWSEEWGEEVANVLVHYAREAMADYEYLYQFRLRI